MRNSICRSWRSAIPPRPAPRFLGLSELDRPATTTPPPQQPNAAPSDGHSPSDLSTDRLSQPRGHHHPLTALNQIFNLRGFHTAALSLHKHDLNTLACNDVGWRGFSTAAATPRVESKEIRAKETGIGGTAKKNPNFSCFEIPHNRVAYKDRFMKHNEKRFSKYLQDVKSRKTKIAAGALLPHDFMSSLEYDDDMCNNKIEYNGIQIEEISPEYIMEKAISGIEEKHYVYRVRDRLRKEVLVPLRKVLELPEFFMAEKQWEKIQYEKVDALAMKFHKEKFLKHDGKRFVKYLKDVDAGKTKIAAEDLFPHSIVESLNDNDDGQVAELQWKRMVDDLSKSGKFKNCLAVSDVSKNMNGVPTEVSLALGLLVSELSEEPWKGKLITFSDHPKLHVIKGDDLKSKIEFVKSIEWGTSARLQSVFDLILQVAEMGNLKAEQMIKRVFVFTDMEFDQASAKNWETDYDVVKRKFSEQGYGKAVPEIVFWNLRDSASTPVPATQKGVALVSGFSKNLLRIFLDNTDGEINPEGIMEAAISGEEYNKLVMD